jgi:hypothetical protein
MPVGNQLKYWDGAAWVSHVAPTGAQGPQGPVGPGISAGMCVFNGKIASLGPGGETLITDLTAIPAQTDKEPCLTVKAPNKLTVVRPGTIIINVMAFIGGGQYQPHKGGHGYIELTKSGYGALSVQDNTMLSAQILGLSDIWPNTPLGMDIEFWVKFQLSGAAPIDFWVYAAVTP